MITILIVEDDDMVRLLTKTKLTPLYRIEEHKSGL